MHRATWQLEITEECLMTDRDRARTILARLRDNGTQIAVDDFGTGQSSLAYLRELPIDELKLDRALFLAWPATTRPQHWSPRPSHFLIARSCGWSPRGSRTRSLEPSSPGWAATKPRAT